MWRFRGQDVATIPPPGLARPVRSIIVLLSNLLFNRLGADSNKVQLVFCTS